MSSPKNSARTDQFIRKELNSRAFPGIQYLAVSKDSPICGVQLGMADIAASRQMNIGTTMMIYSMSKTFTAAAVLQLVERRMVSLEDPAAKFMSAFPYGEKVTIRHLLSQTSGIPNPIPLKWVHLAEEHPSFNESATLNDVLKAHPKLDFRPGTKYAYSNISYWILGHIVEKLSGLKFEDYVRSNIFRKLGLSGDQIDFVIPLPERHAKGYLPKWSMMNLFKSFIMDRKFFGGYEDEWLHIKNHYLNGPSFGGIVATTGAIGEFLADMLRTDSRLFSAHTRQLFFEQQKTDDGSLIDMTLGWHIGKRTTERYYFKEGGGGGFHSEMRIYPDSGIGTVAIANNTSFHAREFLTSVDTTIL